MNQQQPIKKSGFNKLWLLLIIPVVLFVLLLIGAGVGYGIYRYVTMDEETTEVVELQTLSTAEAISILDGVELWSTRIQEIERTISHDGTPEQENLLKRRIIALKDIYNRCFLVDRHSLQSLNGVYMIHSGELSQQQLKILKWFFSLSDNEQQQYEYIEGPIENFVDFRAKVEKEIVNNQNH